MCRRQAANRSTPAPKFLPGATPTVTQGDEATACSRVSMRTTRSSRSPSLGCSISEKSKPALKFLPPPRNTSTRAASAWACATPAISAYISACTSASTSTAARTICAAPRAYGAVAAVGQTGQRLDEIRHHGAISGGVPLGKPSRVVVAEPDLPAGVLPDQRLEWQVDARGLLADHQRRAALRIAEDEDFGRTQGLADGGGAGGVVDAREQLEPACLQSRHQPAAGFCGAVRALDSHQSVSGVGVKGERGQCRRQPMP